jgi:hypothetical protein
VLLTQMQQPSISRNEFFKDMCNWMVSANIPWFKLQMPKFWSLLEKYCTQHIPDQSTLRKHYLSIYYEETSQRVAEDVRTKFSQVKLISMTKKVFQKALH